MIQVNWGLSSPQKKMSSLPILCCLYHELPLHPYHPFRHAIGKIPDADSVEVCKSKHLVGLADGRAKFEAKRRGMSMVVGSDSHFAFR